MQSDTGDGRVIDVRFDDGDEVALARMALWARANEIRRGIGGMSFSSPGYRNGEKRERALLDLRDRIAQFEAAPTPRVSLAHHDAIRLADATRWAAVEDVLLQPDGSWVEVTDDMAVALLAARRVLRDTVIRHNPKFAAKVRVKNDSE